jgi:tRNA(Ile2) C34 agmatinyltransferase TiaS
VAYIKMCPECGKRSISASKSQWMCPHCGEDLSDEPVFREIMLSEDGSRSLSSKD